MIAGVVRGDTASGAVDFGVSRKGLAAATASPYGILVHASARPEKEWPEASWIALGPALSARGGSLLLPWGGDPAHARTARTAAAVPNAPVPAPPTLSRLAALTPGASFLLAA